MKKDQEQEKQDKELIENIFSRTFEKSYEQNFDKVYDEVYHEYKNIRDKNEYQKFKEDNGYNNLFIRGKDLIKTNVKGKTQSYFEGYQKSGNLLMKIDIKKKNTDISQKKTVLNPKIKEKIEQAVKAELKISITRDKKKKFPENNLENDNNNTKEMTRVLDTKMMYPMNNKKNNNKLGENKQNNNELKILKNNNISINHNNEKQEYNQKSFNDIENKTNWLKIGNKHSKKKIKDNSIGV